MNLVRPHLLLAFVLWFSATVHAQGLVGPSAADWGSLSPQQRGVLAPLERNWGGITPAQQQKWIEVANRYHTLPPDERARVQTRMGEWSRMSTSERARARLNFQEARQLSREERQQQWEAYRALPPDQRRALAERAQAKPAPRAAPGRDGTDERPRSWRSPPPQPVGPTVVQRGSGATTNLVSKPTRPPLHQQSGLPKVAATPGFVDAETLLPQRGAQGAGTVKPREADSGKSGRKSDKGDKGDKNK